jgi:antitoxin component of RelBE/YafQ-DinJ toxin-antitoxin module
MAKVTVLGTKVEEEFANKVQAYCSANGLTPSTLIRSLLEEELMNKKPITSIYSEINEKFKTQAEINEKLLAWQKPVDDYMKSVHKSLQVILKALVDDKGNSKVTFRTTNPNSYGEGVKYGRNRRRRTF